MIANYHTHTFRCGHACGTEREYVENAIAGGLKVFGFSDHTPRSYSPACVMTDQELEDYVSTVLDLKREYKEDIEILLGLEVEYYPHSFDGFIRRLEAYPMDYLILSQHFAPVQGKDWYCGSPMALEEGLSSYCELVKEGMSTGMFTYLGHPDLVFYQGEDVVYEKYMRDVIRAAKRCKMPLELNLLGLETHRNYPDQRFWRMVGEEQCPAILGADAHSPEDVYKPHIIEQGVKLADQYGVELQEFAVLKRPVRQ